METSRITVCVRCCELTLLVGVFFQVPCLALPMSRDPTGEERDAGWSQQPHRRPPDGMVFHYYGSLPPFTSFTQTLNKREKVNKMKIH